MKRKVSDALAALSAAMLLKPVEEAMAMAKHKMMGEHRCEGERLAVRLFMQHLFFVRMLTSLISYSRYVNGVNMCWPFGSAHVMLAAWRQNRGPPRLETQGA